MPDVVEVRPLAGYRVHLRFSNGAAGELDLRQLVGSFTGVFAPLADETEFARVRVEPDLGTIVWPCGADLCPDVLYAKITGKPIVADVAGSGEDGS